MSEDESSVRVAVRVRPQLPREILDMCRSCTTVTPGEPQVTLGTDKSFTYDYVFDTDVDQAYVYDTTVKTLVQGSLEGYNATVLAYGQTGSGKTYTMGTGFDVDVNSELVGIIPRAIHDLFDGISDICVKAKESSQTPPQFKVTAQFLELYNEEIIDLFESAREFTKGKGTVRIHEDSNHCIYVTGVRSEKISSPEEALQWLKQGALARTTAATDMNTQSSRSHAIFTIHIRQQRVVSADNCGDEEGDNGQQKDFETLSAKFHFVDLAGSERLKRTGATGDRAKEGISINCGLLALGNVISALGDTTKRALHVPYRDSKLTRLLQDSLGGNSRTLMIACVSPSDRDFMETLSTLNYANRARNIRNKVVINQDKSSRTISLLKKQIQDLQLELFEYKQGKRIVSEDGVESVNDMFHENTLLQSELDSLRTRVKGMQQTIDSLTVSNIELLTARTMASLNQDGENKNDDMSQMIQGYLTEIENLRAKLMESESTCAELRKAAARSRANLPQRMNDGDEMVENIIELAKKEVEREKTMLSSRKKSIQSDDSEGESESSESDGEGDDLNNKNSEYSAELASLTSEISMKQKLIDALEKNQKKLQNMKQHYEEKLMLLQERIQATVKERDSVLASYCKENNQPSEKVKKIKDDYEKRIAGMQREMKSLQSAKKEHAKLLKNQSQYESQIRTLSSEVGEMKKTKVKLMNKMKEEAQRHKEAETRRNREIAQLKKQSRMDANLIKKMEAEKRAKMVVLKRKQEEVAALRTAASRKNWLKSSGRTNHSNAKEMKNKWVSLEKNIVECALNKQSLSALEKEMNRKLESRAEIQEELRQKRALLKDPLYRDSSHVKEEVENLQANLDHVQSAISDLQNEILLVEENKVTFEGCDVLNTISRQSDASYILEKLYNMALHQSCLAAMHDMAVKELNAENEQLKKDSEVQMQLLQHLVESKNKMSETYRVSPSGNSSPETSSRSTSPVDNGSVSNFLRRENGKQRKKMMVPADLLFQNDSDSGSTSSLMTSGHQHHQPTSLRSISQLQPYQSHPGGQSLSAATSPEHHPAPGSILAPPPLTRSLTTIKVQSVPASPVTLRKGLTLSPRINRKTYIISSNHPSVEKGLDASPPGSPPVYRRQTSREENVFSRLTSQWSTPLPTSRRPGKITAALPKRGRAKLQCTHTVDGHTKAVLGLHATNDSLFTASTDKSVIMWDLHELREARVFSNFTHSVVAVKYDPNNRLLFCGYSNLVKVIDVRSDKVVHSLNASCLSSADGLPTSWSGQSTNNYEVTSQSINAIALNESGTTLYTAASTYVRIWDLRKFSTIGKLVGNNLASIMCLAVSPTSSTEDVVVTGSKDHYIKVFNVGLSTSPFYTPRVTLEPPHYDGIQCLALQGQTLFSGSRDCHIKKWTLDSHDLVTSVNAAHRDWVTDLCYSPSGSVLISASRDGTVKLWSVDSCADMGEIKAHDSPINALAANSTHIFTASNDAQSRCRIWKLSPQIAV
ncbi:kinesin family member [Nesidiocoris tenuis]|uniref:Kinesin family member n=1 Tax=Nesidiocoris tenuis TaxID=355587 RepID=A0ABN7AU95_9HEMI|nr:kinesin family member [Nesidiocoris tenuis]